MFLDDFEKSEKGNEINVSNSNTSEQHQVLSFGEIQKSPKIEFIGPSMVPLSISFNHENIKIHPFDFDNVYWIERHWGYGSCPHLFFNFTDSLKYQGEIFNYKPNHISLEQITIPRGVNAVKIAELEKEITYINFIKINDILVYQNVILKNGDEITFEVKTNDIITVEGYYRILSENFRNLPKLEKNRIIKRFKKTYAKQSH